MQLTRSPLLNLPIELRRLVYELLLIAYLSDRNLYRISTPSESHSVHLLRRKAVCPSILKPNTLTNSGEQRRWMWLERCKYRIYFNIALTCSTIHFESMSVLYSENLFAFSAPKVALEFTHSIGSNLAILRSLTFDIEGSGRQNADLEADWIELLYQLSERATNLRWLEINWLNRLRGVPRTLIQTDLRLGRSVPLIRALAYINQLDRLTIRGFYALHWPTYLREVLHPIEVIARSGYEIPEDEFPGAKPSFTNGFDQARFNQGEQDEFKLCQYGTEDIYP